MLTYSQDFKILLSHASKVKQMSSQVVGTGGFGCVLYPAIVFSSSIAGVSGSQVVTDANKSQYVTKIARDAGEEYDVGKFIESRAPDSGVYPVDLVCGITASTVSPTVRNRIQSQCGPLLVQNTKKEFFVQEDPELRDLRTQARLVQDRLEQQKFAIQLARQRGLNTEADERVRALKDQQSNLRGILNEINIRQPAKRTYRGSLFAGFFPTTTSTLGTTSTWRGSSRSSSRSSGSTSTTSTTRTPSTTRSPFRVRSVSVPRKTEWCAVQYPKYDYDCDQFIRTACASYDVSTLLNWSNQLLRRLYALHSGNIYHLDIKSQNVAVFTKEQQVPNVQRRRIEATAGQRRLSAPIASVAFERAAPGLKYADWGLSIFVPFQGMLDRTLSADEFVRQLEIDEMIKAIDDFATTFMQNVWKYRDYHYTLVPAEFDGLFLDARRAMEDTISEYRLDNFAEVNGEPLAQRVLQTIVAYVRLLDILSTFKVIQSLIYCKSPNAYSFVNTALETYVQSRYDGRAAFSGDDIRTIASLPQPRVQQRTRTAVFGARAATQFA